MTMTASEPETMARKRDPSRPQDVTMKLDVEVARKVKIVAEFEGKTAAEYLSEIIRPIVERDLERHSRAYLKGKGKGKEEGDPGPKA